MLSVIILSVALVALVLGSETSAFFLRGNRVSPSDAFTIMTNPLVMPCLPNLELRGELSQADRTTFLGLLSLTNVCDDLQDLLGFWQEVNNDDPAGGIPQAYQEHLHFLRESCEGYPLHALTLPNSLALTEIINGEVMVVRDVDEIAVPILELILDILQIAAFYFWIPVQFEAQLELRNIREAGLFLFLCLAVGLIQI